MTNSRSRMERIAVPLVTALTAVIGAATFATAAPAAFRAGREVPPTVATVDFAQPDRFATTAATVSAPGCPIALIR